jgi:4'-phosphopantetheinyl transferase EntD
VYFDFEDAEVSTVNDSELGLVLTRDVGSFARGAAFCARWSVVDGHVLTAVEVRP